MERNTVKRAICFIAALILAAAFGFVACIVIRLLIDNGKIPTEFYYGDEILLSEYQNYFYDDPEARLQWAYDTDIIEISEEEGERVLRAVGIGKTHVTVSDEIQTLGGDSIIRSFDITVSFREAAVDAAVRSALTLGKEDKIAKESLLSLTSLDLSRAEISTCEDLSPLTGLRSLTLSGSTLPAVKEGLFHDNKHLAKLDLSGCKSLKEVPALYDEAFCVEEVDLSDSGIEELNFSELAPGLRKIDVSGTALSSLDFSGSTVEEIVAEDLIVSSAVTVSGLADLKTISFRGTQLPSLTVNGDLGSLAVLDLGGANILGALTLTADFGSLEQLVFGGMNVRGAFTLGGSFHSLSSLQLTDVTLNSLEVKAAFPAATSAALKASLKEGLTFSPVAPLLSSVTFTGLDVGGAFELGGNYPNMDSIELDGISVGGGLAITGVYEHAAGLSLNGAAAESVTVTASFPVLKTFSAENLTAKSLNVSFVNSAERFDLTDASIAEDVAIQGASALTELSLEGAEIGSLRLMGEFMSLRTLTAETAKIGALSASDAALPALTRLSLPNSGLERADLAIDRMASLSGIDLSGNDLPSFAMPAEGSASLVSLDLSDNAISYFSIGANYPALQTLLLNQNRLSAFTLSVGLESLASLSVGGETLTRVALDGQFPALKTVNCDGAAEAAVSFTGEYALLDTLVLPSAASSLTLNGTFAALRSILSDGLQIKGLSLSGDFDVLTEIDLCDAGLQWIAIEASLPSLDELLLDGAIFDSFTLHGTYPSLGQLDLNNVTTTAAGISLEGDYPVIKEINAENLRVSGNIELKGNFGRYSLDLNNLQKAGTQDPSLIFSEGNAVMTFSFGGAQISTLTASSLPELVSIDGSSANVGAATFSDLPQLTTCTLKSSSFGSLEFSGDLHALLGLNLKEANVSNLRMGGSFSVLEGLSAENTSLSSADFNGAVFDKLSSLDLSGNRLTRFTLNFGAPKLSGLDLSENRLETFLISDDGRYESLKNVNIGGNGTSTAGLNLTLGGELPALDNFTFTGSTFGTIALNGSFENLTKISLSNVTFQEIVFGKKWSRSSAFTVSFSEVEEFVYGNMPMPVPFALKCAGNVDALKNAAGNATGATLVYAAFEGDFGGELTISPDADKFGIYGTSRYDNITLRPTNGSAKLYFYNVTLANGSGSVIDLQSSSSSELHFYGTCSLERSGAEKEPKPTIVGRDLSILAYNTLKVNAQNGSDAVASGSAGNAGGVAISCNNLQIGGEGDIQIYGGHGGNGANGADGDVGKDPEVGGNGGAGGIAVVVNSNVSIKDVSIQIHGGNGGRAATGGAGVRGTDGNSPSADHGQSGTAGGAGAKGGTGGAGAVAIRAASAIVNEKAVISLFGGNGGAAGQGGLGGDGGNGGNGGSADHPGAWTNWGFNGGNGGAGGAGGDAGDVGNGGNAQQINQTTGFENVALTQGKKGDGASGGTGGNGGTGGDCGERHTWFDKKYGSNGSGGQGGQGGKSSNGDVGDSGSPNSGKEGGQGGLGGAAK